MSTESSIIVVYDVGSGTFNYPADISSENRILFEAHKHEIQSDLNILKERKEPVASFLEVAVNPTVDTQRDFIIGFVSSEPWRVINIVITDVSQQKKYTREMRYLVDFDSLTGLYNKDSFTKHVDIALAAAQEKKEQGKFAMIYLDIVQFKAINEIFGQLTADSVLKHIATSINNFVSDAGFGCRIGSDRFCAFVERSGDALETGLNDLIEQIAGFMGNYRIICNVGVYVSCQENLTAQEMIGRAILAQGIIKGSVNLNINYFHDEMRKEMLTEQEITSLMNNALKNREFVVYYQPQYEHSTKSLVGAEALVRWIHPDKGMISPAVFIPIFENNGFITNLDLYVFECSCMFIRRMIDEGENVVPVSSNFSRHDLFDSDLVAKLEEIRKRHNIEARYLRIEITESSFMGESDYINELINKLHNCGYIVEMDDFGSGYSSLNTLKDIDFDIIKLDMKFMDDEEQNNRGGTILSSVVRMANWLNMPVIAEGVETKAQADYLKSIGSDYVQGYLYSKPLPEADFEKLLMSDSLGSMKVNDSKETSEGIEVWDPKSLDSLIFTSYVGPAAIFEYRDGLIDINRINGKYLKEFGMRENERDVLMKNNLLDSLRTDDKQKYIQAIENVIATGQETTVETWRKVTSKSCGTVTLCIRTDLQLLGKGKNSYLLFANIRNITTDRHTQLDPCVIDEAATYHWEYVIGKKEMYPCMRCMQDLNLPERLENYPEPVIENGIFPHEIADFYRDWHKQLDEGKVSHLEAVLPLTDARIPHLVKYDLEFDSIGRPVKAYGSATPYNE